MGNKPTITSENVWQSAGNDFLQLVSASGQTVEAWIDSNGIAHGGLSSGQVTKTLYVDGNRTDQYTPDGSFGRPFTHIMDAVNQVVVNGDNSASVAYLIDIAAGVYQELIVLENLKLFNLIFEGHNAAFITGGTGNTGLRSQANNSNLNTVIFNRMCFNSGSNNTFTITMSPSVSSNWEFLNCERIFLGSSSTWTGNANFQMNFYYCHLSFTALTLSSMLNGVGFFFCVLENGAAYSLTNGSILAYASATRDNGPLSFSIDATSNFSVVEGSRVATGSATIQVNGIFLNRLSLVDAAISVNSGGTYSETFGVHTGTLTINGGGTYNAAANAGVGTVALGAATPVVTSSQVALGISTANTATAGGDALPSNPAGFWIINVGGNMKKIPYYNP